MSQQPSRKLLRSPVLKRRSRAVPKDQKVTLERVLGLTSTTNAALACDPNTGTVAYLAGCVVVLYNHKRNKQSHILNFSRKTLTSVAFSGDGKHLVTGESGFQPAVRVWDVAEKVQIAEHHGHKFGISCVAFSPNLKYLVSIGTQHDMMVNVWNWKTGSKVSSNKVASKVSAVAFSGDGSHFVTVGMRHVKFWYLESSKSKINETLPLQGRNGILGDLKNNFFCDVSFGAYRQTVFVITQAGLLCQFSEKRQIEKWVDLRTSLARCLSAGENKIYVGCANGVIRVFDSCSLKFVTTLPHPHHLGIDIATATNPSQAHISKNETALYPHTLALVFDKDHRKVTCIYNDHSLYMWDVHDLKKVGKGMSFLYHSSCIYGVEVYPVPEAGQTSALPPNSFITCSSDDTIRIWNLDPHMPETSTFKGNIYSNELLKVMYMDPALTYLCDVDYNPSGAADKTDTSYDDKNGIRCIRVSPDGQQLASGDRQGNIRIHGMHYLEEVKAIEAHESEVLCLEFSNLDSGPKLLASTSRDRLVHVFDTEQQYGLLQTLADHSASISAVRFAQCDDTMKMITCGADKSILFRNLQLEPEFQFTMANNLAEKTTLYDMDVEPTSNFAAFACQDRNVRIYNVKNGKKKKDYKGSLADDGVLLRIKLDPSGSYVVTSCTDKNLCILDFYTGELLATMYGHSEIPTDVKFMNDLRHVLSVSGDGCVFVWRLPIEMTKHMQQRLTELGKAAPVPGLLQNGNRPVNLVPQHIPRPEAGVRTEDVMDALNENRSDAYNTSSVDETDSVNGDIEGSPASAVALDINSNTESPKYRFSVGHLPNWAKSKIETSPVPNSSKVVEDQGSGQAPRGRWAQRLDGQGLVVKAQDGKVIEVDIAADRRRFTYEADSLGNSLADLRRETMVLSRPESNPKNLPVVFDEETYDEDEDDGFLPSYSTKVEKDKDMSKISWDDLIAFDNDDLEQPDDPEIIYYPPSESEGSDTLPSSYHVFAPGGDTERKSLRRMSSRTSISSNADADSETTDPISLDDTEEDNDSNHSTPSTPMDEAAPKLAMREKFLKDTFENLSFTPELSTDKFSKNLDTLEEEMTSSQTNQALINSRLSISARFLSRSQQANIKNMAVYSSIQRQDNWYDSVQKRKDDMARNLDESRKMLMAMGWKKDSPEGEHSSDDPFDASQSPSPKHDPALNAKMGRALSSSDLEDQTTPTNFNFDKTYNIQDPPASPRTPKSLRRCWSTLDLPKQPIPEEKGPKSVSVKPVSKKSGKSANHNPIKTNPTEQGRSKIPARRSSSFPASIKPSPGTRKTRGSSEFFGNSSDENSRTPTSRSGYRGQTSRPRTLVLNKDQPKDSSSGSTARISLSKTAKKQTPTSSGPPSSTSRFTERNKTSGRLSVPGRLNQSQDIPPPENRRVSTGANLSKSKSVSMQALSIAREKPKPKEKTAATPTKPRSKWTSKLASYASVPNLLTQDDDDVAFTCAPESNLTSSSDLSRSVPDVNNDLSLVNTKKTEKSPQLSIATSSRRQSSGAHEASRRSCSTGRLSIGTDRNTPDEKRSLKPMKRVGASVSSVQGAVKEKEKDKSLMPPPAKTNVIKSKQENRFVKRAHQQRRKTTSDMTLDQAKAILRGNSGILNKSDSDSRKGSSNSNGSSSQSPPTTQAEPLPERMTSSLEFAALNDPKFMSVAKEIEETTAELRLSSDNSQNFDIPERDIPTTSLPSVKSPRTSSLAVTNSLSPKKRVHKGYFSSENLLVTDFTCKSKDSVSSSDEGIATMPLEDGEEYQSPSVKDRIARLNLHVDDRTQSGSPSQRSHSPTLTDSPRSSRSDSLRSTSPHASSPRVSSAITLNFDNCRGNADNCNIVTCSSSTSIASISLVSTMSNNTCNATATTTTTSSTTTSKMSPRDTSLHSVSATSSFSPIKLNSSSETSQSLSQRVDIDITPQLLDMPHRFEETSPNSLTQILSPRNHGNLTSSFDADALSKQLSPGSNNSNHNSPGSVADTGVGSDTDTELSNSMVSSTSSVFRKSVERARDPVTVSQDMLAKMQVLMCEYTEFYKQVNSSSDERSQEAAKVLREGSDQMSQQLHQTFCEQTPCLHVTDDSCETKNNMVSMPAQTYNSLMQKMSDVFSLMNQSKPLP